MSTIEVDYEEFRQAMLTAYRLAMETTAGFRTAWVMREMDHAETIRDIYTLRKRMQIMLSGSKVARAKIPSLFLEDPK